MITRAQSKSVPAHPTANSYLRQTCFLAPEPFIMIICLKTSFDWRHKILNSLDSSPMNKLTGVIEADETFFLYSEKGNKSVKGRKPRKRGGKAGKKGINKGDFYKLNY